MRSGAWLQLLLTLGALGGLGATETVLGALGGATLLRVPAELRERARQAGEAAWKRVLEGRQRKKFLLRLSGGNSWALEPGRLRFHSHDFSLEILNTSREDRRLYEFSVSGGDEEEVWQVQLEVLEPVARASVRILARDESNGSCSVSLRCSAERGDAVSFSWARGDSGDGSGDGSGDSGDSGDSAGDSGDSAGDSGDSGDRAGDSGDSAGDSGDSAGDRAGPCSGSGPVLNLSLPARGAPFGCVCTARNPVSSARAAFRAWPCGAGPGGGPGMRTELLVPLVALGLVIIIIIVTVTLRAKCDRDPPQATLDSAGATVYAQVQKPEGIVPKATPPASATIYAAATGPPPAPDGAPRSPAGSPSPRGPPPLSQEPTTVYASVTLPVA